MGTFGTGAFSSDGAVDFLDELAELSPELRAAVLEQMFEVVREKPEMLWRQFFPDQVVAAAAIVAATLPGGEQFGEELEELVEKDVAADARLVGTAPALAKGALEALLYVAGPEGPWHKGWTNEADAVAARGTTDTLSRVLGDASR
jgi:alpha-glucosidase